MHKLKVLHVTPTYFSSDSVLGGAERYVDGLANEMGKHCDCTVLSFGKKNIIKKEHYTLKIKEPLFNINGSLLNPLHITFLRDLTYFDIIHCHQIYTALTEMSLLFSKITKKKVFLTDHGGGGRTFLKSLNLLKTAKQILAVSNYSLSKFNQKGVVVFGGINPAFQKNNTARIPNRIVSVGRLLPHKGFHHLIRAISDQELIIIGSPADKNYLSHLKNLSIGKNITFINNLTDSEVCSYLNSAMFAVCASTKFGVNNERLSGEPELFGQAPLEAMACGTPTLMSDVGSYPEIALPNADVLLFNDGNFNDFEKKFNFLVKNQQAALQLGEQCFEHAKKFNWYKTVKLCFNAYEEVEASR